MRIVFALILMNYSPTPAAKGKSVPPRSSSYNNGKIIQSSGKGNKQNLIKQKNEAFMVKQYSYPHRQNAINIICFLTTITGIASYCLTDSKSEYHLYSFYLMCCGFEATALNMIFNIPSGTKKTSEPTMTR